MRIVATLIGCWQLLEHVLGRESAQELPDLESHMCCQCQINIESMVFTCCQCGDCYCFETPGETSGGMCIDLDYFAPEPLSLPCKDCIKEFPCHNCWNHDVNGLYQVMMFPG
jgi:hypothetical protein